MQLGSISIFLAINYVKIYNKEEGGIIPINSTRSREGHHFYLQIINSLPTTQQFNFSIKYNTFS